MRTFTLMGGPRDGEEVEVGTAPPEVLKFVSPPDAKVIPVGQPLGDYRYDVIHTYKLRLWTNGKGKVSQRYLHTEAGWR